MRGKVKGDFPGMKRPGRNEVTVSTGYISCKRYSNYKIKFGGFMEYLLKYNGFQTARPGMPPEL